MRRIHRHIRTAIWILVGALLVVGCTKKRIVEYIPEDSGEDNPVLTQVRTVRQASDGGFIIAASGANSEGASGYALLCTDATGSKLWSRVWVGRGARELQGVAVCGDGSFVVSGTERMSGDSSAFAARINDNGTVRWQRQIGTRAGRGGGAAPIPGGGIVAAATLCHDTAMHGRESTPQLKVERLNDYGDTLWTITYPTVQQVPEAIYSCGVIHVYPARYVFTSTMIDVGGPVMGVMMADSGGHMFQTNHQGEIAWANAGAAVDESTFVLAGCALQGSAGGKDLMVQTLDLHGGSTLIRKYGGPGDDEAYDIQSVSDAGISWRDTRGKSAGTIMPGCCG